MGPLAGAVGSFDEARYAEAARAFRELEPELGGFSRQERARYALYRGLTHLALGDSRPAERWLVYAKAASERDPELLDGIELRRLRAAWYSMGRMPGDGPR